MRREDLLVAMFEAAYHAGETLISALGRVEVRQKEGIDDVVTDADIKSQEMIVGSLQEWLTKNQLEDVAFLGEERDLKTQTSAKFLFVIDPLDGTRYFSRGSARYSISIALLVKGVADVALVYAPSKKIVYGALRGNGAFRADVTDGVMGGRVPLSITPRPLSESIANLRKDLRYKGVSARLSETYQRLELKISRSESFGPTTLSLCSFAEGLYDIVFDHPCRIWDLAAASLIVREAGGVVNCYLESEEIGDTFVDISHDELFYPLACHPTLLPTVLSLHRES